MEVKQLLVMRGPGYWSVDQHKLIVLKLDTDKLRNLPVGEIKDLLKRALQLMPTLKQSRLGNRTDATLGAPVTEDTTLVELVGRMALELQWLSGMETGFGFVAPMPSGSEYRLVFSYVLESAGRVAAHAAVQLTRSLLEHRNPQSALTKALRELAEIYEDEAIGPSTQSIIDEAESRGIPAYRIGTDSLVVLGQGKYRKLFQSTVMGTTSNIAVETVGSKPRTKQLLNDSAIPVPPGFVVNDLREFKERVGDIVYPAVVKPVDGNHGRGITANITNAEDALKAWKAARKISDRVIIESYIEGDDYRILVINYKLAAAAKRTPARVVGDGVSTVRELLEKINCDPDRGEGHSKILTVIRVNAHTRALLREQGLSLRSVIEKGKEVLLKKTANLSTGGTATDVTDDLHPDTVFMAERIAKIFQLDVCGIDIMAKDISRPLTLQNGAVIEVNAGPGFRMHTHPSEGKPRNVARPVVDLLFPSGEKSRIPIVAVTGTNGKTTIVRLVAHIAQHAGMSTGSTTTEGVYIGSRVIYKGDCSGPQSARMVLGDPCVDYAVLECARGGILRSGLAFDYCDISIVSNVTGDHLGLGDIHTIEEYARVKSVLPRVTKEDGYTVLNADDPRVLAMKDEVRCNVVLFSMQEHSEAVERHCADGGTAVVLEDGNYVLREGVMRTVVLPVSDVPLTFNGTAGFMVQNILPAIAAAYYSGFGMETIRGALRSFEPSVELTPGRMNLFDFGYFRLMLDYAHNAGAFEEIGKYMAGVKASQKIIVVGGTGDRRDEDLRELGRYAAQIFDELIIRYDEDTRNRTGEQITGLLVEGIRSVHPQKPFRVIPDEQEALDYVVRHAKKDAFVFVCADKVWKSIEMIRELQEKGTSFEK